MPCEYENCNYEKFDDTHCIFHCNKENWYIEDSKKNKHWGNKENIEYFWNAIGYKIENKDFYFDGYIFPKNIERFDLVLFKNQFHSLSSLYNENENHPFKENILFKKCVFLDDFNLLFPEYGYKKIGGFIGFEDCNFQNFNISNLEFDEILSLKKSKFKEIKISNSTFQDVHLENITVDKFILSENNFNKSFYINGLKSLFTEIEEKKGNGMEFDIFHCYFSEKKLINIQDVYIKRDIRWFIYLGKYDHNKDYYGINSLSELSEEINIFKTFDIKNNGILYLPDEEYISWKKKSILNKKTIYGLLSAPLEDYFSDYEIEEFENKAEASAASLEHEAESRFYAEQEREHYISQHGEFDWDEFDIDHPDCPI